MSKYTEVKDGKVVNVVVSTPEVAQERGWMLNTGETIGDLWDGNVFTKPPASTTPDYTAITRNSHKARLQGRADTLSKSGLHAEAMKLLLKANEV